jgi:hypothetical protein
MNSAEDMPHASILFRPKLPRFFPSPGTRLGRGIQ